MRFTVSLYSEGPLAEPEGEAEFEIVEPFTLSVTNEAGSAGFETVELNPGVDPGTGDQTTE